MGLDALRGVAALCVAALHLKYVFHLDFELPNAPLAVDFFFILSGFVLAHSYSDRLADGAVADYLVARARRLLPLIALGTLVAAAALISFGLYDPRLITGLAGFGIFSIPYLGNVWFSPSIAPLNPPAWSLFFEIAASIAFGLGLWRGRYANIAVLVGGLGMLAVISVTGVVHVGHNREGFWFGFVRVAFGFGLGTWLYRAPIEVPALPIAALAAVLAAILLSPFDNPALQAALVYLVFPIIVLSAAEAVEAVRLYQLAGEISYPLYMIHWPTYLWIAAFFPVHTLRAAAAALGAAVAVSVGVWRVYDEPLRRRLAAPREGEAASAS